MVGRLFRHGGDRDHCTAYMRGSGSITLIAPAATLSLILPVER